MRKNNPLHLKKTKSLSLQQKNYIRGIQIARNVSKKKAINLFKRSQKDSTLTKSLTRSIQKKYETGISFKKDVGAPPKIKKKKGKKPSKKYIYAGKPQKASKAQIARFKVISGKSRRYIDTHTGEEISRRERDKRL